MRAFLVTIRRGQRRCFQFEAMSQDWLTCVHQHRDLVGDFGNLQVLPLVGRRAEMAERRAAAQPALARLLHTTRLAWWRWQRDRLQQHQSTDPRLPQAMARVADLEAGRG